MTVGQIAIRRATVRDAQSIAQVHDDAWRVAYRGLIPGAQLERMIARRGPDWWIKAIARQANILVMEVGGRLIGYATIGPTRMRMLPFAGEIYELYIRPDHQGLGFGKRLFKVARDELARLGLRSFIVRVLAENDPARLFYRGQGSTQVAETAEMLGSASVPIAVHGFSG